MKGDSQKTELELLSKVLNLEKPISIEKTPETEEKTEMTSLRFIVNLIQKIVETETKFFISSFALFQ